MSYRQPAIIKNQSGLIVPQAIAKAAENISQTWSKQLSDQRKLNIARKEEDRKNDLRVADEIATIRGNFKPGSGGEEMLRTAKATQNAIANQLFKIRTEKNNRGVTQERMQELADMEAFALQQMNSVNDSFAVVQTNMEDIEDYSTNTAANFGKKHIKNQEQFTFAQGLKDGKYEYVGYEEDENGNLIYDTTLSGATINAGGVTQVLRGFNSDGFSPIGLTTQVKGTGKLSMLSTFVNAKGNALQQGVLSDKTYETTKVKTEDGKFIGNQIIVNTDFTDTANAKFNESVQETYSNIFTLEGRDNRKDVLIKQYNFNEKDVEAFELDSNDPKITGKLLTSIASIQAGDIPGNIKINNLEDPNAINGRVTNFKLAEVQEGSITKPSSTSGTGYTKKYNNTLSLFTNAARVDAGQTRGSNKDVFAKATGILAEGKQISINGRPQRIRIVPAPTGMQENTTISYVYGTPLYTSNPATANIANAQKAMKANDRNAMFLLNGTATNAHDYLVSQGLKNQNQINIDFTNPASVSNQVERMFKLQTADAQSIVSTHFSN